MLTLAILETIALTNAQRGATPSGHALLLGTQRTGTTWAMAELDRSPCVSTTSELFIQFKWERGARMNCLKMLYGDADARDRSLGQGCAATHEILQIHRRRRGPDARRGVEAAVFEAVFTSIRRVRAAEHW